MGIWWISLLVAVSAVAQSPATSDANTANAISRAAALYDSGDVAAAQQAMLDLVAAHPDSAEVHFKFGNLYAQRKLFAEAAEEWNAALRIEPRNTEARLAMVKALLTLDRYGEALAALQGSRENFNTHVLRGAALRGLGEDQRALADFEAAVKLNPDDYDVQYNLGFVLARLGRAVDAREHLQRALTIRPNSSEARYQLAMALKKLGQNNEAQQELQELDRQKKDGLRKTISATALMNANELLARGDARAAVARYAEAIRLDPTNATAYYNLALAEEKLGDSAATERALRNALEREPKMAAAHNRLGLLLLTEGKAAEAEREFQMGIDADPRCAECNSNLGVLYGRQGNAARAEKLFRDALQVNPAYVDARVNLGLMLAGKGQFAEAESEFRAALLLEPANQKALTGLGMVQTKLGKADSVEAFRKIVDAQPSSVEARLNLGIALADSERVEAALSEFSEAVRLAPRNPAAHYNNGRALNDLGRPGEAAAELDKAIKLAPDYVPAIFLSALVEQKLEHYAHASELLRAVVAREPNNVRAWDLLGQTLQQGGGMPAAVAAWKTALRLDPNRSESLYALFRALAKTNPRESKVYEDRFLALKDQARTLSRAQTASNFGLTAAAQHDWPAAIAHLREALKICGECASQAELHKNLGLIACQSGDIGTGEKELLLAQKDKPADPDIVKALQMIADRRRADAH